MQDKGTNKQKDKQKQLPAVKPERFYTPKSLAIWLALVCLLLYGNTLKNGYALDDVAAITRNRLVQQGVSAIPEIFSTPYHWGFHPSGNDLYRPLSLVMFAVEHQFFPGSPIVGHLLNVLLFVGCVIVLFFFLLRLLGQGRMAIAFVACLLFAVHPIHTEVVANIKSRDELLCFFLAFLSLTFFIRFATRGALVSLVIAGFCFFSSLLAKETSITFLFIVPLVFFAYINENIRRSVVVTAVTVALAGIYIAIRFGVLHAHGADVTGDIPFVDNALVQPPAYASRFATAVLLLGMYIKLLLLPHPLICDYSFDSIPFVGYGHWGFLLSFFLYSALIVWGIYRLVRFRKDVGAFAILLFLLSLSLFTNIFFLLGATMAERFVFFASAGFCLGLALLLASVRGNQEASANNINIAGRGRLILLVVCLAFGYITVTRNRDWADNYTLYSTDVVKAPRNMRLHWFLGNELTTTMFEQERDAVAKKRIMEEGIAELQKALAIYPDMLPAHEDLGHAFFMVQQFDSAMRHSRLVLRQDPKNAIALFNISGIHFSLARYDSSIAYCHKAALSDPGNFDIPRNIAFSWLQLRQFDSSILYFKKVLARYPDSRFCNNFLARAYEGAGLPDSSRKYDALASMSIH